MNCIKKRFCFALVLGLTISTIGVVAYAANSYYNRSQEPVPTYDVNENGLTYGSAVFAVSPDTEPDLISAIGIDGTEGYVYSVDLQEDLPKTPEEAVIKTKALKENVQQVNGSVIVKTIPLYDIDGKTVIGEFAITSGLEADGNGKK